MYFSQNLHIGIHYPPLPEDKQPTLDSGLADSDSSGEEQEEEVEENEQSASKPTLKRGRHKDPEVTSKHTSSGDLGLDDLDPKVVHNAVPVRTLPPLSKKQRQDPWDLDILDGDEDDDDSE